MRNVGKRIRNRCRLLKNFFLHVMLIWVQINRVSLSWHGFLYALDRLAIDIANADLISL